MAGSEIADERGAERPIAGGATLIEEPSGVRAVGAPPEHYEPVSPFSPGEDGGGAFGIRAAPGAEGPSPPGASVPGQFEGVYLRLRRSPAGRQVLGIDIELTPEGSMPGRAGLAWAEGGASAAGAPERFEGEDPFEGEGELPFEGEGEGEGAFARGVAGAEQGEVPFEGEGEGEGGAAIAAARARPPERRWPNRLPVPEGIAAISQDPALFGDDPDEAGLVGEGAAGRAFAAAARAAGTVSGMLVQARRTLGMGESPPGSNRNAITAWYNRHIAPIGHGPWCNMAVTYWAGHSGNLRAIFGGRAIGYAYTVAHARKFQSRRRWRTGTAGIRAGDIVFFDWTGTQAIRNIDHVGVVERVSAGRIITIEGNTSNRCRRMVRSARYIVGYGRPAYGT